MIKETFNRASALQVTLFCAVAYLLFLVIYLYFADFIVCSTIKFGELFTDPSQLPGQCALTLSPAGYDGQFFYRLALDPLLNKQQDFGVLLDTAPYRQQRILLPAITSILSFNNPAWVPFIMLAINYFAICGVTFVFATLLQRFQSIPAYALLVAFYPGFAISLTRSLSEPLAILFILFGILNLLDKRYWLSSLSLCCAVLTRETALIVAATCGLIWLLQMCSDKSREYLPRVTIIIWLLPLLGFIAWQSYIYHRWGVPGFSPNARLQFPFAGIINSISNYHFDHWSHWFYTLEIVFILIFTLNLLFQVALSPPLFQYLWIAFGILTFSLSQHIWNEHYGFLRVLSEFHILGFFILIMSQTRFKFMFTTIWIGMWFTTAIIETSITYNIWEQNTQE